MSLINDALKRAQKAQSQTPPPAPPTADLRPAEPTSYAWQGIGLLLPAALALVALLALFLVWEMSRQRAIEIRASTAPRAETPASVSAPSTTVEPAPTTSPRPNGPVGAVASTPSQNPTAPGTNAPAADEADKPAPPKLQAVIYNPRNPSAVISGHTVFRGDRLGAFRVMKITPDSATLVGQGQTNLLFLEH